MERERIEEAVQGVLDFARMNGDKISAADARQYLAGENEVYQINSLLESIPCSVVRQAVCNIIHTNVMIDTDKTAYLEESLSNLNTAVRTRIINFFIRNY